MVAVALVLMCALISAGCGGGASIQSWQHGVEQYIKQTGRGDPTVLRDVKLPDGRRGFSVLGAPDARQSQDVNAVLLGHATVQGKPCFIYLLGVVEKFEVQDIRLATLAITNGKYEWQIGKEDDQALKTYRAHNERIGRERFPDRKSAPAAYTMFPQSGDEFELNVAENSVTATHRASGARWGLSL
jgi:hypothetical protein